MQSNDPYFTKESTKQRSLFHQGKCKTTNPVSPRKVQSNDPYFTKESAKQRSLFHQGKCKATIPISPRKVQSNDPYFTKESAKQRSLLFWSSLTRHWFPTPSKCAQVRCLSWPDPVIPTTYLKCLPNMLPTTCEDQPCPSLSCIKVLNMNDSGLQYVFDLLSSSSCKLFLVSTTRCSITIVESVWS